MLQIPDALQMRMFSQIFSSACGMNSAQNAPTQHALIRALHLIDLQVADSSRMGGDNPRPFLSTFPIILTMLEIVPVPADKSGDAFFQGCRRGKTHVDHQVFNIGTCGRNVA
jgi:hypothetical protein